MTTVETDVRLLPFYCPIDPAIHPETDAIERRAVDWIDRLPLHAAPIERAWIVATNSAEFYARFAPYGDADGVELAARWVYFGFAYDDAVCDNGQHGDRPELFVPNAGVMHRALEAPDHLPADADRFGTAIADIARDMRKRATPTQVRRFVEAHRLWLHDVGWQVANRARGRMPDLAEYAAMRLGACGGAPTYALLEIANGGEIPAAEMDAPLVRAVTEAACTVAGWDNDLHSYRKEAGRDDTDQNIVNVIAVHRGIPVAEAMAEAVRMRDRIMTLFLRLRAKAARTGSTELCAYLDCLGHGIRGNIDWALRVPRYISPSGADEMPVEASAWSPGWSERPSDPDPAPVPISTIAWWWDLLD